MLRYVPKVSVIMPVFNGEKYLKVAIDSILNQTYRNLELIIINDGSTDSSRDIINSYEDARIQLYDNKGNKGLIYSLNKGLDVSDGDYVARMDSDDFSLPDRIEKQVEYMETHPKVGVCGTWFSVYNEELTESLYTVKVPEEHELLRTMLFTNSCMCHPSTMFRIEYFDKYHLRYKPEYKHAEDYALWMDCVQHFELANIQEVLLLYRSTPTGVCHMYAKEQKASTCKILSENLKLIGLDNLDQEMIDFHFRVIYASKRLSLDDKKMLVKWYYTLVNANCETGYYDEDIFISWLVKKIDNASS